MSRNLIGRSHLQNLVMGDLLGKKKGSSGEEPLCVEDLLALPRRRSEGAAPNRTLNQTNYLICE